ncbi:MAG: CRISPR-associated helicase Cas3' [Opitutaceae bacterium]|jgi:CRISPR-associated helicase Cas3/CRISPR-associated endonuclease Cas3-HD
MNYYAHTADRSDGTPDPDESRWQPLRDHLVNVAELAAQFAAPFGASEEARLAGLLHDLGKYSSRFQQRLRDPSIHGINHWSMGTLASVSQRQIAAAFAIEGHHTGMPAFLENDADTGLEALKARLANLQNPSSAHKINGFTETLAELTVFLTADGICPPSPALPKSSERDFATALRTRMLFSALVDADFLDTEQHFDGAQAARRTSVLLQPEVALPHLLAALAKKSSSGFVNQLRRKLLNDVLAAAENTPGLFTLTAPTGSGKTLAALAFALRHAAHYNAAHAPDDPHRLRRIIVVIPYTSIIEQTARIYRELFEPLFGSDYVLEHHSAIVPRERRTDMNQDSEDERLRRARLAQENWDAPLVVTTNVQFFESLFGHRPSQCRKLHNISGSVVLFDEVQTLPVRLVPSLLSVVTGLVRDYGVTAVFGTATQPAFTAAASAIPGGWQPVEISSQPKIMADGLRRTRIVRRSVDQQPTWSELASEISQHSQVLCVVNLKCHAHELFLALPEENRFHLSSAMCPAHRQAQLAEIRRRLDRAHAEPCRLISTQLIEAGVDVDFPCAYRAVGPLDSIIQTAGRCNREGLNAKPGEVTIFRPLDHSLPPGAYTQATKITEAFLAENPDVDLHNPATYAAYFARLYGTLGPASAQDDPAYAASAALHFPLASRECSLVGDDTRSVVVRWGDGDRLVSLMRLEKHLSRDDWRLAQRFSVNFYLSEFSAALAQGIIVQPLPDTEFYFWNGYYDEHLGVTEPTLHQFSL